MPSAPDLLLTDLLEKVSRSFYLTLRALPKNIRLQIGLAYLLARTTDTIADTEIVPLEQRLKSLQALRERILGGPAPLDFGDFARRQGSAAERTLLESCDAALALLEKCSAGDQKLIREVLDTITSGQELDLRRFAGASENKIVALQSAAELDDYTYRVAGCVGEFWTKMCRTHVFPGAKLDEAQLLREGVRFGKGLQLVNILRDVPADLRKGRCYLPAAELARVNLSPADLLISENERKLRPVYDHQLDLAESHLVAGWSYTNSLPWRAARVRLACAWPILIGLKTLIRLRSGHPLDLQQRIKISRREVRGIIFATVIRYPFPRSWRALGSGR